MTDLCFGLESGNSRKINPDGEQRAHDGTDEELVGDEPHSADGDIHDLQRDRQQAIEVLDLNVVVRSWTNPNVLAPLVHPMFVERRPGNVQGVASARRKPAERACLRHFRGYLARVLAVLSPAKKLDFSTQAAAKATLTVPQLRKETAELSQVTAKLSAPEVAKLMKLSPQLGQLNFTRFQQFDAASAKPTGSRQAAFAFDGDTYVGLGARTLSSDDLTYAQEHVWILSGLYGVLRPLDAILPYRLEMGTKLSTERGSSLYDFWGDRISKLLSKQLRKLGEETLINLASNEYFGAVDEKALSARVITPVFKENRGGQLKIISFSAKRARGAMARFMIEQRLDRPEGLQDFRVDGYKYQKKGSNPESWLFVR